MDKELIAAVFTEWERRYREDPEGFMKNEDVAGESTETYGQEAARTFLDIFSDISE